MPETKIVLTCNDEVELNATVFEPPSNESVLASLIIAPALGVPRSFYTAFAIFCCNHGIRTLVFDYRGAYDSPLNNDQRHRLEDWGQQDLAAAIEFCSQWAQPIHLIGHSIGGQVVGLANNCDQLKSIHLVAASAPYWKRWGFPDNLTMLFSSFVLFPLITRLSKLINTRRYGLGSQFIQSSLIRDWARWMRKPDYLFAEQLKLNTASYQSIVAPLYAYAITDDKLAPRQNIDYLVTKFPMALIKFIEISPKQLNTKEIGHTELFKERIGRSFWPKIIANLQQAK